jgi:hypothetical protein
MAKRRVGVARPESTKLSEQVENQKSSKSKKPEYDGNTEMIISTGSTLLDLAISGGRIKGGGLPFQFQCGTIKSRNDSLWK